MDSPTPYRGRRVRTSTSESWGYDKEDDCVDDDELDDLTSPLPHPRNIRYPRRLLSGNESESPGYDKEDDYIPPSPGSRNTDSLLRDSATPDCDRPRASIEQVSPVFFSYV